MASILDALPGIFASAMGQTLFRAAWVYRASGRTSDGRGGTVPIYTRYACRALVDDYTDYQRAASGIPDKHRKAIVLAATVSVAPQAGDILELTEGPDAGAGWALIEKKRDPAGATYEFQCKTAAVPVAGITISGAASMGGFAVSAEGWPWAIANGAAALDFAISGQGSSIITGGGDVAMGEFVVSGASGVENSASGDIQIGDFAVSGEGSPIVVASGVVVVDDLVASGEAYSSIVADGAGLIGDFVVAGVITVPIMADGAAMIGEFTIGGDAGAVIAIDGAVEIGDIVAAGSGVVMITAAGAVSDEFAVTGGGSIFIIGAGAVDVGEFATTGAGSPVIGAAGDITMDGLAVSGAGSPAIAASAAIIMDGLAAAGAASVIVSASGAITMDGFAVAGAASVIVAAAGAPSLGEFTAAGAATVGSSFVAPSVASASWSWNGASASNASVNKPSGVAAGDLLIAFTWATQPAGGWDFGYGDWNEVADDSYVAGSDTHYFHIAWKVAGSSEPSAYTFTNPAKAFPADGYFITFIARVTGDFDPTTPLGAYAANAGTASFRRMPSLSAGAANSLLVFATDGDSAENPSGLGLGRHINGGGLDVYSKAVNSGATGNIDIPTAASAFSRTWGVIVNPDS